MINFAAPLVLLLLPLPLLVWRFAPPHRQRVPAIRIPFFERITRAAGAEPRAGAAVIPRRPVQMAAAIAAWALLILGLASPERIGPPVEITKSARDMMLVIDISGSMDERDFRSPEGEPLQRLDAVKDIVGDFIEAREGDRVGLIVFGTRPFVQAPFTEDLQVVSALLQDTEVGMAGPHTGLGDALGLAMRTFESSEVEDQLLILMSDGADTGSRMSPVNAAEIAARRSVQIVTVGVGNTEGEGVYRLDAAALEDIADRAGGAYYHAEDADALAEVYARIDQLAPRAVETVLWRERTPLGHLAFGSAALVGLTALALLHLGSRRRGGSRA